tara:strand:- start:181 stop:762 length:582 start_codon:yes stop_codon:yes gene_type:complete
MFKRKFYEIQLTVERRFSSLTTTTDACKNNAKNGIMTNLISEEESDALDAIQGHQEAPVARWQRLRRRILLRNTALIIILLVRATAMIALPEDYLKSAFPFLDDSVNLADIAYTRLLVASFFLSIYLYAFFTNRYLRSASMLGVVVGVALFWSDAGQYLTSGWGSFTIQSSISFGMRILTVALLVMNYLDVRR